MRLVCTSDTHSLHNAVVPEGDVQFKPPIGGFVTATLAAGATQNFQRLDLAQVDLFLVPFLPRRLPFDLAHVGD